MLPMCPEIISVISDSVFIRSEMMVTFIRKEVVRTFEDNSQLSFLRGNALIGHAIDEINLK